MATCVPLLIDGRCGGPGGLVSPLLVDLLLAQVYVGEVDGGGACSLSLTYILEAPLEEGKVFLAFPTVLVDLLFAQV
jgi:hypothetical protein